MTCAFFSMVLIKRYSAEILNSVMGLSLHTVDVATITNLWIALTLKKLITHAGKM